MALTLMIAATVYVMLYRSGWGLQVRAVTQNRTMAEAVGINTAWSTA
jgi:urea transport system permease protein